MNAPKDVRPFSLDLAQQGHPLITRDGRTAKFIAYVPENDEYYQVVVAVSGQTVSTNSEGMYYTDEVDTDVFLAPLGYCQGLPVFAGDVLEIGSCKDFVVDVTANCFDDFKWPSKAPVIETRMIFDDYLQAIDSLGARGGLTISENQLKAVANKAIERAIMDGDVMPTSLFVKLAGIAYNERINTGHKSFTAIAEDVLKDYLDTLK